MLFCSHFAPFRTAFCTILHYIQHHFALHLAAKRIAFSGILHRILQQIAPKMVQMTASLNKNTSCLHLFPIPFSSKPTFARIDFLRQGRRLVNEKATYNVNFIAKNQTNSYTACVGYVQRQRRYVRLLPSVRTVAGHSKAYNMPTRKRKNEQVVRKQPKQLISSLTADLGLMQYIAF